MRKHPATKEEILKCLLNLYNYLEANGYPHSLSAEGMLIDLVLREIGFLLGIKEWEYPSLKMLSKKTIEYWHSRRELREKYHISINDSGELDERLKKDELKKDE